MNENKEELKPCNGHIEGEPGHENIFFCPNCEFTKLQLHTPQQATGCNISEQDRIYLEKYIYLRLKSKPNQALSRILENLQSIKLVSPWILADDPPECPNWEEYYYTLEEFDTVPKIMQAQQIWLNEGSEVFYYQPIRLPTETCQTCKCNDDCNFPEHALGGICSGHSPTGGK